MLTPSMNTTLIKSILWQRDDFKVDQKLCVSQYSLHRTEGIPGTNSSIVWQKTAIALPNSSKNNGGWQSPEQPSLGKSAPVLCLAKGLRKVILVFSSYNLNYSKDKTIATCCGHIWVLVFSQPGRNPDICSLQEKNSQTKPNKKSKQRSPPHQLFCCF